MRYWFPFFWLYYYYYFCFVSEITFTFYDIIIPLNPCNRKCRLCRTFSNSFMHCLTVIVECVFIALRLASNFGPQLSYQMVPARSAPSSNTKPKRPGILPLPCFLYQNDSVPYSAVRFTFKATNLCMRRGGDSSVNFYETIFHNHSRNTRVLIFATFFNSILFLCHVN